jgi:hypothetical protein
MRPLLLAATTVLAACSGPISDFCTLEARPAVQVKVVDTRGNPRRDARVTFTRDGGPEQQASCVGQVAQGGCDTWVTEYERPGQYAITATSADGTRTARQSVTVSEDECHVHTETVTLTLPD